MLCPGIVCIPIFSYIYTSSPDRSSAFLNGQGEIILLQLYNKVYVASIVQYYSVLRAINGHVYTIIVQYYSVLRAIVQYYSVLRAINGHVYTIIVQYYSVLRAINGHVYTIVVRSISTVSDG